MLLDLLSEMSLVSSPIFFHCFSNSGCAVYQFMICEMMNNQQYAGMAERVIGRCRSEDEGSNIFFRANESPVENYSCLCWS